MSTGRASRALMLTSACLRASGASPRHSANFADGHRPACSSKRTVRLINGIALDECRARERYPARRPFYNLHLRARVARTVPPCGHQAGNRDRPEVFARVVQQKRHDVEGVASAGASPAASTISACKH